MRCFEKNWSKQKIDKDSGVNASQRFVGAELTLCHTLEKKVVIFGFDLMKAVKLLVLVRLETISMLWRNSK